MLRQRKFSMQLGKTKDSEKNGEKLERHKSTASVDIGWVGPITLKKRAKPALENERYRDISLRLSVQEAKCLPSKGKYFCEICLDRILYARTTSKQSEMEVFWGEKFELNNLPDITIITINLYKHGSGSTKEKRQRNKETNQFIAFVTIPLTDLPMGTEYQQWLTMQVPQVSPNPVNAENWSQKTRSANQRSSIPAVQSPTGGSFRKRSTPVTCFRYSTSSAGFSKPTEDKPTETIHQPAKKKRSWTVGVGGQGSSGSRSAEKTSAASANVSPAHQPSRANSTTNTESPTPQIRLAINYETMDILPLGYYNELREFLKTHSLSLIRCLEPKLSAKQKEELASCFVNIHEKVQELSVAKLLSDLVLEDLQQNADESMLMRANSVASKAFECYIKLVGTEYLQSVLKESIDELLISDEDFEIDPMRVKSDTTGQTDSNLVEQNRMNLLKAASKLWKRIIDCISYLPYELREVFFTLRRRLEQLYETQTAYHLISSCLFLRFICPAIHGPVLFGLAASVPESTRISRNLTLVAKVLQTVANQTLFGEKEAHMKSLNSFVEREVPVMRAFLDDISSISLLEAEEEGPNYEDCHYFIDLGYEFAKLAQLLSKYIQENSISDDLPFLRDILGHIREHTADNMFTWASSTSTEPSATQYGQSNYQRSNSIAVNGSMLIRNSCDVRPNGLQPMVRAINVNKMTDKRFNELPTVGQNVSTNGNHLPVGSDNRNELLSQYRQHLRELNDCINRVDSTEARCTNHVPVAVDLGSGDTGQFVMSQSDFDQCMIGESQDDHEEDHLRQSEEFDASDYERGDMRYHTESDYCTSEPISFATKLAAMGEVTGKEIVLSSSPSLDQLAEKLQELKLLLKHERHELAQVVASKTKAIEAQEQSIEQLASELDQLRRAPSGRCQQLNASQAKTSSETMSPSSSFSSEYCFSHQSDGTRSSVGASGSLVDKTHHHRHHWSESGVIHDPTQPIMNGQRSNSFISRVERPNLAKRNSQRSLGQNLMDLTRTSAGTGIPLEDLISKQQKSAIRKQLPETRKPTQR